MSKDNPLISIIVPIYNVEAYLERCIDSLIAQTYTNIEIILVNDGSTDSCLQICEKYKNQYSFIKLIDKKNGGLSDARNCGLDVSNGEYIGFVDSDDFVSSYMYEKLYNVLTETKSDIAVCNKYDFDDNIFEIPLDNEKKQVYTNMEFLGMLLEDKIVKSHVWNKLYKRYLFDNLRFDVGKCFEDVYIMHRIILKSRKIVSINDSLYYYYQRENSILGSLDINKYCDLYWAYRRRLNEVGFISKKFKKICEENIYFSLWSIIKMSKPSDFNSVHNLVNDYNKNVKLYISKRDILLRLGIPRLYFKIINLIVYKKRFK